MENCLGLFLLPSLSPVIFRNSPVCWGLYSLARRVPQAGVCLQNPVPGFPVPPSWPQGMPGGEGGPTPVQPRWRARPGASPTGAGEGGIVKLGGGL